MANTTAGGDMQTSERADTNLRELRKSARQALANTSRARTQEQPPLVVGLFSAQCQLLGAEDQGKRAL